MFELGFAFAADGIAPIFRRQTRVGEADELQINLQEVLTMLLEDGEPKLESEFVRVQTIKAA